MNDSTLPDARNGDADRVDLSAILVADYAYIAQTAFQANEDRARATTYYLLSIGTVLAAVFASNTDSIDPWRTAVAFAVLFGALGILGFATLLQLARLRAAWFNSVRAMNHIKRITLENQGSHIDENPFPWTDDTLPESFEPKSVAAFLALEVVVMATIMVGASVFQIGLAVGATSPWLAQAVAAGLGWGLLGSLAYFWALRPRTE